MPSAPVLLPAAIAVLLLALPAPAAQAQSVFVPGDVNADGTFDTLDGTVIRRALVGLGPGMSQQCLGPVSGQTTLYTTEDDGHVQAGFPLAYNDNGDGTITDLTTGLTWEKKDFASGLHHFKNTYCWDPVSCSGYADQTGNIFEWADRLNGVCALDETFACTDDADCAPGGGGPGGECGFAGHQDWRIPHIKEQVSLLDYEATPIDPMIAPVFTSGCVADCTLASCGCTADEPYWTATTDVHSTPDAWQVGFGDGAVAPAIKTSLGRVRAVRGGLASAPVCGNDILESGEECDDVADAICPSLCQPDCSCGPEVCGDAICSASEDPSNCLADCPAVCGDAICSATEDPILCPADCPDVCGDGLCSGAEDFATCPADCPAVCDSLPALLGQVGCPGEACDVINSGTEFGCRTAGAVQHYGTCSISENCQAGAGCFTTSCLPYCDAGGPVTGCPSCGACLSSSPTPDGTVGLCLPDDGCDVPTGAGCSAGDACYPIGCGTFCFAEGTSQPGASCSFIDECVSGYLCFGQCIRACHLSLQDCPVPETCIDFGSGVPDLGACSP